jgi:hypothetical protein
VLMGGAGDGDRDLASLAVPRSGALVETGRPFEPYQLVDPCGVVIGQPPQRGYDQSRPVTGDIVDE